MKNKFYYYQLLDEREEQLINKAGTESFYVFIGLILLGYLVAALAPALFNPNILLVTLLLGIFFFFNFIISYILHYAIYICHFVRFF